jgi:hypothetical protein
MNTHADVRTALGPPSPLVVGPLAMKIADTSLERVTWPAIFNITAGTLKYIIPSRRYLNNIVVYRHDAGAHSPLKLRGHCRGCACVGCRTLTKLETASPLSRDEQWYLEHNQIGEWLVMKQSISTRSSSPPRDQRTISMCRENSDRRVSGGLLGIHWNSNSNIEAM